MTAPAVIKQSELRRVVSMAKEAGVTIELEKNGVKIRVIPETPNIHIQGPGGAPARIRL